VRDVRGFRYWHSGAIARGLRVSAPTWQSDASLAGDGGGIVNLDA
jgi:hypothetical protein